MADFQKLARDLVLADNEIDEAEVKILKRGLLSGGKVSPEDLTWLLGLHASASKKAKAGGGLRPAFEKLFYQAIEAHVLEEGKVSAGKVTWLRENLFGGKKIDAKKLDAGKKAFVTGLGKKVKEPGAEFKDLLDEVSPPAPAAEAGEKAAKPKGKKKGGKKKGGGKKKATKPAEPAPAGGEGGGAL
jgi:hypothetical protein